MCWPAPVLMLEVDGKRGLAVEHAPGELEAGGGVLAVAGDAALGIAREVEVGVDRRALRGRPDVGAGLAHALHGGQRDHAARPLDAVRGAAGAAPAAQSAGRQVGFASCAHSRARARISQAGTPTLGFGPLAGLGQLAVASCRARTRPTPRSRRRAWPRTPCRRSLRSAMCRRWQTRARGRCRSWARTTCRRSSPRCGCSADR